MNSKKFDEQYERAKKAGEEANQSEPRAESARYESRTKRIIVRLRTGEDFSFSPEWVPGLRRASSSDLANIKVSPSGAGLHWETLDEDLSVSALVQGIFGPANESRNAMPLNDAIFENLCAQIEIAWNSRAEASLVDRLAAEHPEYSAELYDFFALLIESELDSTESEEIQRTSELAKNWLESEGLEAVHQVIREQRDETIQTTPTNPTLSQPETLKTENQIEEEPEPDLTIRPIGYIGLAQERTELEIEEIEKQMGVPATILKFTQRQPPNELRCVRNEIVRRGTKLGIQEDEGREALNYQIQRAAKRGAKKRVSTTKSVEEQFKELIEQIPTTQMNEAEKEYWIELSRKDEE